MPHEIHDYAALSDERLHEIRKEVADSIEAFNRSQNVFSEDRMTAKNAVIARIDFELDCRMREYLTQDDRYANIRTLLDDVSR